MRDYPPLGFIDLPWMAVLSAPVVAEELSRLEWLEDVRTRLGIVTIDGGPPRPAPKNIEVVSLPVMPELVKRPDLPVAYCASGRYLVTALALALKGEIVSEVVETSMLEGTTDAILVSPGFDIPLPPFEFNFDYRSGSVG